eukprot:GEMP01004361.1.p1 GENE.GEMP01004361.1~~GEMP01004361.1.p1  ORF type:complete len:574 (+),score=97.23 GEMP01004361.1:45-1766(+)
MEHEELEELTEFRPCIGGEYESKDARGNWWDITITAENPNGTFCADVHDGHDTVWDKVHVSNVIEKPPRQDEPTPLWRTLVVLLLDVSVVTLLCLWHLHGLWIPSTANEVIWWSILGAAVLWRCRLMKKRDLPFSCVRMETAPHLFGHDVDVYMCGTMHVSPGSVTDTKAVISKLQPDIIMIELDKERLRDMKEEYITEGRVDRYELELQVDERAVRGIHADWNSSCEHGLFGSYPVILEEDNPYGEKRSSSLNEHVYVCRRGKQSMYAQTIWAEKRGARGVVIIDDDTQPEVGLISAGGVCRSLANCLCHTRTVAMPSIPTFLVREEISDGAYLETFLKSNEVPRPIPFKKKLCRAVVLAVSGIGILYEVIRKAGVKVGHEFLTADAEAEKLGHPCVCIDISVGNLGARLKKELYPSPINLWNTGRLILALPRTIFTRMLFPIRDLDIVACMLWAFARFKVRTWLAFIVASTLACLVVSIIVLLPGFFISTASNHFSPDSTWGKTFETFFPFVCELYIFPAIYRGLLDQRDEEMYRAIASQVRRRPGKKTFVAVVGAAHVNGIIARGRRRGL